MKLSTRPATFGSTPLAGDSASRETGPRGKRESARRRSGRVEPKHDSEVSRQSRYYRRTRAELFAVLGHECANCFETEDLEFDVIIPVGGPKSHHGKMSSTSRVAFYKRQLNATPRNLQVLCSPCNSSKNARDEVQIPLPQDGNPY